MKVQYTLKWSQICAISALITQIEGRLLGEGANGTQPVEFDVTLDQKSMLDSLLSQEGCIVEDKPQWPSKGDEYYYIDNDGDILVSRWDITAIVNICRHDIGNIFKTEEEAVFEIERLKVLEQLKRLSDDDQEWNRINQHYHITYNIATDMLEVPINSYMILPHGYWFKSRESAEAAIKAIGKDNLKKYVFNVKE